MKGDLFIEAFILYFFETEECIGCVFTVNLHFKLLFMIKNLVSAAFCLLCFFAATAQEKLDDVSPSAAKDVFLELGGNGGFLSLNYDTRFSKSGKGLGARIGVGFIPPIDAFFVVTPTIITIPLGLNYLAGNGPHHLEIGAGITLATAKSDLFGDEENAFGAAFVPSLGYRYQPRHRGFTARVFASPFIGQGGATFFAGVSGGIRF